MGVFRLFRVKAEERLQAVIALAVIVVLNGLFIYRMHGLFMQLVGVIGKCSSASCTCRAMIR